MMAVLAHRFPKVRSVWRMDRRWRVALLAALGTAMISSADAQSIIGGEISPGVTVDLTVLERLGPAPTLPQLFPALHASAPTATATALATPPAPRVQTKPAVARRIVLRPPPTRLPGAAPAQAISNPSPSVTVDLTVLDGFGLAPRRLAGAAPDPMISKRSPTVAVDLTVLDRLGPAPTRLAGAAPSRAGRLEPMHSAPRPGERRSQSLARSFRYASRAHRRSSRRV